MVKVLDTHALLAYLWGQDGAHVVKEEFKKASEGETTFLMTSVNWGEVYYLTQRRYGSNNVEKIMKLIESFSIEIIPADLSLAREAAKIKFFGKLSYADCFAAALAKIHKAVLLTGDPDFKHVEKDIKILWIK
jgi:predicted nucleic acid-binding protein